MFPQARIATWGYEVQIEKVFSPSGPATIFHHAQTLLSDLTILRNCSSSKSKPLVFVAHSLGGIVIKDALSWSRNELTCYKEILPATKGVIFLGTPHHGSKVASLGKIAFELAKVFLQHPATSVLRGLERNSEVLERITRSFGQVLAAGSLKVHSFRESLDTNGVRIVDAHSSSIGYSYETTSTLHANHRNMAKMSSAVDPKFQKVTSVIQRWLEEGLETEVECGIVESVVKIPDGLVFDEEYQQCVRSLNYPEARNRIMEVDHAFGSTYDWVLEHSCSFRDWLRGEIADTKYWIQGKPGSGKSTLMRYIMLHSKTRQFLNENSSNPWIIAAYFFHDRGVAVQKSILGFLRELLYQILLQQKHLFPLVYNISHSSNNSLGGIGLDQSQRWASQTVWTIASIKDALSCIASKSTYNINAFILVDALDEHDGDHQDLLTTLNQLAQLNMNSFFRLRLCLAGRRENVFKDALQGCPGLIIHDHTTTDIRLYAEGRLLRAMKDILTDDGAISLSILVEDVVGRAEGVFLWVRLVADELAEGLREGDSIEELRDLLLGIPTELGELYTRALRRRSRTKSRTSQNSNNERYVMFQIIQYCRKPFSIYGLMTAAIYLTTKKDPYPILETMSSDQIDRRLQNRSAGLLDAPSIRLSQRTISCSIPRSDHDSCEVQFINQKAQFIHQKVQFIHQTVKEYMSTGEGSSEIMTSLRHDLQQSGHILLLRFFTYLLLKKGDDHLDFDWMTIKLEFLFHAQEVDRSESARRYFEPDMLQLVYDGQTLADILEFSVDGLQLVSSVLLHVLSIFS